MSSMTIGIICAGCFWLTLLFVTVGLFAPRIVTVFSVLLVCALSVSSAIFLVLEICRPKWDDQGFQCAAAQGAGDDLQVGMIPRLRDGDGSHETRGPA